MDSLERNRVPSPRSVAVRELALVDRTEEIDQPKKDPWKKVLVEMGAVRCLMFKGVLGFGIKLSKRDT